MARCCSSTVRANTLAAATRSMLVRVDKALQALGYLVLVVETVTFDDARRQTGQSGILDRVDQLVELLVLQKRLKRSAIHILRILQSRGKA